MGRAMAMAPPVTHSVAVKEGSIPKVGGLDTGYQCLPVMKSTKL
jgi:hypothetical protein